MADVYIEVGLITVSKKYAAVAQDAMKAAITATVQKSGSGMTLVTPLGRKGVRVNAVVTKLAQDGNDVNCVVISDLYELPGNTRLGGAGGKGAATVTGKIDAVAGACVGAAVTDLMSNIGPAIVGSRGV